MGPINVIFVFTLLLLLISSKCSAQCVSDYYQNSCPSAEETVAKVVADAIYKDTRVGPRILRMFFHDCFVEGCDGSILIDLPSNDAEKDAVPNLTLDSFNVIDDAKAAVEDICPQTVSCADVLAFAAVTSVAVLGGPRVDILGGRLDGFVSKASEVAANIPAPTNSSSQLQTLFSSKGLDNQHLVVLSGAHTIGKAHCTAFSNRLYPTVDGSLNSAEAGSLEQQCPQMNGQVSNTTVVDMDVQTPTHFDNAYHQNVADGKAPFTSDAALYSSSSTSDYVNRYAANNYDFLADFGNALIKMGQIGVKTGSNGNIRKICSAFNS